MKNIKIVISGSFRKHYNGIKNLIEQFESIGIDVLSPNTSKIINPKDQFVILESDTTLNPQDLEQKHLDLISEADALYVYNPNGYVGLSTSMEIGWAISKGKTIYSHEESKDYTLKLFSGKIATPIEIKKELLSKSFIDNININSSLMDLQHYIHNVVNERGFDDETSQDIMLLMVEEVGELAKSIRKSVGLKIDKNKIGNYTNVKEELADVLIYLLDLANSFDINIYDAFIEKERENNKRFWQRNNFS